MNSINKIHTGVYSYNEIKNSLDKYLDCDKPNKQNDVKRIITRIFDHLDYLRINLYDYKLRNSPHPTGNYPVTEEVLLAEIDKFYGHCTQRFGSQKQKKHSLDNIKKFIIDNVLMVVTSNLKKEETLNKHKSRQLGNVRQLSGLGASKNNKNRMNTKMKYNKTTKKKHRNKMPFELIKKNNTMRNPRKHPNALKKSLNQYTFNEFSRKQGLNPRILNKYKGGKRKKTKKRYKINKFDLQKYY